MPKHLSAAAAALAALALTACGEEPPQPAAESAAPGVLPADNVFKPYADSLERARGVEQTLQQGLDRQRQFLEEPGR